MPIFQQQLTASRHERASRGTGTPFINAIAANGKGPPSAYHLACYGLGS
jgi:hypothetical protein